MTKNRLILEPEFDITLKSGKWATTTQQLSSLFVVNVIYALDGSRSERIQRWVQLTPLESKRVYLLTNLNRTRRMLSMRVQGRKMRTGIPKRMVDLLYMVRSAAGRLESWLPGYLTTDGVYTDTEAPSAAEPPADPFGHLEKTIDQQTWAKQKSSRLTELYEASDRLSSDPYLVSSALRRKFREEKKVALAKQARDFELSDKFGLRDEVILGDEDVEGGRERWIAARERRGLPVSTGAEERDDVEGSVVAYRGTPSVRQTMKGKGKDGEPAIVGGGLAKVVRRNTARKFDPFAEAADVLLSASPVAGGPKARGRLKDRGVFDGLESVLKGSKVKEKIVEVPVLGGLVPGYESD